MILNNFIKTREEEINHKYDIRKVYYIALKGYENIRFLDYIKALEFFKSIPELKEIEQETTQEDNVADIYIIPKTNILNKRFIK